MRKGQGEQVMRVSVDGAEVTPFSAGFQPLPGHVLVQHIRCGKPGCRCQHGQTHGPYLYRIWREGKRVRKMYVRSGEADRVRAQTALYAAVEKEVQERKGERLSLTKSIKQQWALFAKERRMISKAEAGVEGVAGVEDTNEQEAERPLES